MVAKLVSQLEIKGQRDEDVFEMAKAAAGYFDYYICREDDNRREDPSVKFRIFKLKRLNKRVFLLSILK